MKYPLAIACLIAAVGCGRGVVPQSSTPEINGATITYPVYDGTPTTIVNPVYKGEPTAVTLTDNSLGSDFGDDPCEELRETLNKCSDDVNDLLTENTGLKDHKCPKCRKCRETPKRLTINIDSGNKNKKGTQISGSSADSSIIQSANDKTAANGDAAAKDVGNVKKSGNTKEGKDRFWLGVLVAVGVFQGLRIAKKYVALAPPPFGLILSKVLNCLV